MCFRYAFSNIVFVHSTEFDRFAAQTLFDQQSDVIRRELPHWQSRRVISRRKKNMGMRLRPQKWHRLTPRPVATATLHDVSLSVGERAVHDVVELRIAVAYRIPC